MTEKEKEIEILTKLLEGGALLHAELTKEINKSAQVYSGDYTSYSEAVSLKIKVEQSVEMLLSRLVEAKKQNNKDEVTK